MTISRRFFLAGLIALAGVKGSPLVASVANNLPEIVGDGMHDDSAGLSALFKNEPVIFSKDRFVIDSHDGITIINKYRPNRYDFLVSRTIEIGREVSIISEGSISIYAPDFDEMSPLIRCYDRGKTDVTKFRFSLDMVPTKVPLIMKLNDDGSLIGRGNFYNPVDFSNFDTNEPVVISVKGS